MSASNEWDEWHLTPQGWIAGSEKVDFAGVTEKPIPPDRVLTRRYHERQSSSFSKVDRFVSTEWRGPDAEEVARLLTKFGQHPSDSYSNYRPG